MDERKFVFLKKLLHYSQYLNKNYCVILVSIILFCLRRLNCMYFSYFVWGMFAKVLPLRRIIAENILFFHIATIVLEGLNSLWLAARYFNL